MPPLIVTIQYAAIASAIIPVCTGFRQRGLIWAYVCLSFLSDLIILYLKETNDKAHIHDNLIAAAANGFLLVQYCLIAAYLSAYIFGRKLGLLHWLIVALPSAFFLIHTLVKHTHSLNATGAGMLYCALILLCLAGLFRVIQDVKEVKIERSAPFFVSAGFLIYASSTLLLIMFDDFLTANYPDAVVNNLWIVHNLLSIVINLVFAWAFILQQSRRKA